MPNVNVKNKHKDAFEDSYDGIAQLFSANKTTVVPDYVAEHIFGYNQSRAEKMKRCARLGVGMDWLEKFEITPYGGSSSEQYVEGGDPREPKVSVVNKGSESYSDMYDGVAYKFPPKEKIVIPAAAAAHLFGYRDERAKREALVRRGFAPDKFDQFELKHYEEKETNELEAKQ